MRIAIVTESFLPQVNGVTNTVRHMVNELQNGGHETLVIAPAPGLSDYRGVPVVRVRSLALPGYKSFHLGLPEPSLLSRVKAAGCRSCPRRRRSRRLVGWKPRALMSSSPGERGWRTSGNVSGF